MIDLKEMIKRQQNGAMLIESLQTDEKAILQHFCSLSAEGLLDLGKQRNAPVNEIIINAMRNGIALGLQLMVENGEVS